MKKTKMRTIALITLLIMMCSLMGCAKSSTPVSPIELSNSSGDEDELPSADASAASEFEMFDTEPSADIVDTFVRIYKDLQLPGEFSCSANPALYFFRNRDSTDYSQSGFEVMIGVVNGASAQRGEGIETIQADGVTCFKDTVIYIYKMISVEDASLKSFNGGYRLTQEIYELIYDGTIYPLNVAKYEVIHEESSGSSFSRKEKYSEGYMSQDLMSLTIEILTVLSTDGALDRSLEDLISDMPVPLSMTKK